MRRTCPYEHRRFSWISSIIYLPSRNPIIIRMVSLRIHNISRYSFRPRQKSVLVTTVFSGGVIIPRNHMSGLSLQSCYVCGYVLYVCPLTVCFTPQNKFLCTHSNLDGLILCSQSAILDCEVGVIRSPF